MAATVRIVERTYLDGDVQWVIQRRGWLFRWVWSDVLLAHNGKHLSPSYSSLEEAKKYLCYVDGTQDMDKVVYIVDHSLGHNQNGSCCGGFTTCYNEEDVVVCSEHDMR